MNLKFSRQRPLRAGFSLVEVMIAVAIMGIIIVPAIGTIQAGRVRARAVGLNLIGQNLAVSLMEEIKRAGFGEIAYGRPMSDIMDTPAVPSPLLDFPRAETEGDTVKAVNLPDGAPGGSTASEIQDFVNQYRTGAPDRTSSVLTSDENYYYFTPDQIAAMNGYANFAAVPDADKAKVLDARFAWGVYLGDGDPADAIGGGDPLTRLTRIVTIVKWNDPTRNRLEFTIVESFVSEVAPRM